MTAQPPRASLWITHPPAANRYLSQACQGPIARLRERGIEVLARGGAAEYRDADVAAGGAVLGFDEGIDHG